MKTIPHFAFLFYIISILSTTGNSQNNTPQVLSDKGSFHTENDAEHPCITEEQYTLLEKRCKENCKALGIDHLEKSFLAVPLEWPLKPSDNMTDCGYYFVSAYADHNATAGAIQDFDCGTKTYDTHRGTDIAIWPYPFYKMDHDQVEVIAAAPGTIVDKHDGEFDKNCASTNALANYVVIQHADGSVAYYWHMKNGSITTKAIGETILTGEHVGVVASSGNASGPHLHFEVRTGFDVSTLIDPFAGACNSWNNTSCWANQKPHNEPAILKASVNITDVEFAPCPADEPVTESAVFPTAFQGPGLSAGYAKFYIFMRDETVGTTVNMSIHNPNGSLFGAAWTHVCNTYYKASYYGYSKLLPTIPGVYTFEATYNGATCVTTFEISDDPSAGISIIDNRSSLDVFPNPTNESITISGADLKNGNYSFYLKNTIGQIVYEENYTVVNNMIEKHLNLTNLPEGMYFLVMDNDAEQSIIKINKVE